MVACLIVGVLKEPFVSSPCSLPSSLRGIIASPCCSSSVMFGAGYLLAWAVEMLRFSSCIHHLGLELQSSCAPPSLPSSHPQT
eukprot:3525431-Rhodomonas_salina.1